MSFIVIFAIFYGMIIVFAMAVSLLVAVCMILYSILRGIFWVLARGIRISNNKRAIRSKIRAHS